MVAHISKLKTGTVILLVSCAMASLTTVCAAPPQEPAGADGGVQGKDRLCMPAGALMYVNFYSTAPDVDRIFLYNYATVNILPEISRVRGIDSAAMLGDAIRIRLNPDRMRANNLSPEDIINVLRTSSGIGQKTRYTEKNLLTHIGGPYSKPEQYEEVVLIANPDGLILRLKDVCTVEAGAQSCIDADFNGHPSVAIVLRQVPGVSADEVIGAVQRKLEEIKKAASPSGVGFDVIPFDTPDMIYAVIEPSVDATLTFTSAKCHELAAIAEGIVGITSVWSLAGYDARTDRRDSNSGTCFIRLQDQSGRKLTSRQIIEALEEKYEPMNAHIELFEPPAVSVFVAAKRPTVRVLDRTNANKLNANSTNSNDRRLASASEPSIDDLLNRDELKGLFTFLARTYPRHELTVNGDVARQRGVSIASALLNLPLAVGVDDQGKPKFWRIAEDLQNLQVTNDRGEMVPYTSLIELKEKAGVE
ncbi:MAG TPA: efflux RND transporter permease subunit [Pirellulales bacterium]|jgi:multidrug efflux pump subunit AcrB